jgi:predicted amidohydrolase YtcJ
LEAAPDAATAGADLIIAGGDIVTMNRDRDVLAGGAVAISGGHIVEVGAATDLRARYPAATVLDATGCVRRPG